MMDRQTDGHIVATYAALCMCAADASRNKNRPDSVYFYRYGRKIEAANAINTSTLGNVTFHLVTELVYNYFKKTHENISLHLFKLNIANFEIRDSNC